MSRSKVVATRYEINALEVKAVVVLFVD